MPEAALPSHASTVVIGITVRAARLSYVGEVGWEITCPADRAPAVHDALHEAGARMRSWSRQHTG